MEQLLGVLVCQFEVQLWAENEVCCGALCFFFVRVRDSS